MLANKLASLMSCLRGKASEASPPRLDYLVFGKAAPVEQLALAGAFTGCSGAFW
jgi:hypothetical protein